MWPYIGRYLQFFKKNITEFNEKCIYLSILYHILRITGVYDKIYILNNKKNRGEIRLCISGN